ncbi:hypothetical protein F3J14_03565 [Burkholderia sp. Tr-862]|nr:hypothetical protein [Burkholderia sp. Tr-862]
MKKRCDNNDARITHRPRMSTRRVRAAAFGALTCIVTRDVPAAVVDRPAPVYARTRNVDPLPAIPTAFRRLTHRHAQIRAMVLSRVASRFVRVLLAHRESDHSAAIASRRTNPACRTQQWVRHANAAGMAE